MNLVRGLWRDLWKAACKLEVGRIYMSAEKVSKYGVIHICEILDLDLCLNLFFNVEVVSEFPRSKSA